jgi:hypothetical protein
VLRGETALLTMLRPWDKCCWVTMAFIGALFSA